MDWLWTAFLLGFFGSLHCIGMCGPIALALPQSFSTRVALINSRILYNLGRVITYSLMGLVFGLIGFGFSLAGYQQLISISMGVLILLVALFSFQTESYLLKIPFIDRQASRLKIKLGKHLGISSQSSLFTIGLLNGLLPCGFVYLALSGSVITGEVLMGMLYMALFGLGTLPAMMGMSVFGSFLRQRFRKQLKPVLRTFTIVFALLLIIRGANLGIPYLSPKLNPHAGETEQSCH